MYLIKRKDGCLRNLALPVAVLFSATVLSLSFTFPAIASNPFTDAKNSTQNSVLSHVTAQLAQTTAWLHAAIQKKQLYEQHLNKLTTFNFISELDRVAEFKKALGGATAGGFKIVSWLGDISAQLAAKLPGLSQYKTLASSGWLSGLNPNTLWQRHVEQNMQNAGAALAGAIVSRTTKAANQTRREEIKNRIESVNGRLQGYQTVGEAVLFQTQTMQEVERLMNVLIQLEANVMGVESDQTHAFLPFSLKCWRTGKSCALLRRASTRRLNTPIKKNEREIVMAQQKSILFSHGVDKTIMTLVSLMFFLVITSGQSSATSFVDAPGTPTTNFPLTLPNVSSLPGLPRLPSLPGLPAVPRFPAVDTMLNDFTSGLNAFEYFNWLRTSTFPHKYKGGFSKLAFKLEKLLPAGKASAALSKITDKINLAKSLVSPFSGWASEISQRFLVNPGIEKAAAAMSQVRIKQIFELVMMLKSLQTLSFDAGTIQAALADVSTKHDDAGASSSLLSYTDVPTRSEIDNTYIPTTNAVLAAKPSFTDFHDKTALATDRTEAFEKAKNNVIATLETLKVQQHDLESSRKAKQTALSSSNSSSSSQLASIQGMANAAMLQLRTLQSITTTLSQSLQLHANILAETESANSYSNAYRQSAQETARGIAARIDPSTQHTY